MNRSENTEPTWSLQNLQQSDDGIEIEALFFGHWLRINGDKDINDEFNHFFWKTIVKELLDSKRITLQSLATKANMNCGFVESLLNEDAHIEMPLSTGNVLLELHPLLCEDLQTIEFAR